MMMSSAYVVSFTGTCSVGVSDVYMLKSVGDSTTIVHSGGFFQLNHVAMVLFV